MTILYHSHESLFLRWRGTVLPRTWKLTFFTGALAFGLCYVYDLERKTVIFSVYRLRCLRTCGME